MKKIENYIDATFLKTESDGLSSEEIIRSIDQLIEEATRLQVKLVMIRPEHISYVKQRFQDLKSKVGVGTVIDFPFGSGGIDQKFLEAHWAINNHADELDFVIDYKAFQNGKIDQVKDEVYRLTQLCIEKNKIAKWIIETAALSDQEIIRLTVLIKNVVVSKFSESSYDRVFIKSSTGFFKTTDGQPNGANVHVITLMLENATPLPVKASGGVKSRDVAIYMLQMGVKRLGTSSHMTILDEKH